MKSLPITLKVSIGFVAIMIMFIIVVFTMTNNIKRLNKNTLNVNNSQAVILSIQGVLSNIKDSELSVRDYLITGDTTDIDDYKASALLLNDHLSHLIEITLDDAKSQETLVVVAKDLQTKFAELDRTVKTRKAKGFATARRIVIADKAKEELNDLHRSLQNLENKQIELLAERETVVLLGLSRSRAVMRWMLLVACMIIITLISYVNYAIVVPIKTISRKAEDIALGKLTNEFKKDGRSDEIGLLDRSFRIMQENLWVKAKQAEEIAKGNLTINVTPLSEDDVFGKAFSSMIHMFNDQMLELQQGVNVLSTASNEMMAVMSQLSSGSSETASSVSETSATIEEIKQTTELSSKKADEVTDASRKLASVSIDGKEAVKQSVEGMNNIKQQMESIATVVIQLSERSHKIGEIANTVNDIAEQSNLLAVNASIEAAKAGNEGKGFAVVAQEIKNLARRSKSSTLEIRTILTDIQKEISGAVMATEQGGKVIDDGLSHSFKVDNTISALATNAEDSLQANMLISASSQQQLVGMEQITVAMESIREASVQNSNSTKQAERSVSELTELGSRLIDLLSRYKLKVS